MILRIEKLQDACNKILPAVDTSFISSALMSVSEYLQLYADNSRTLTMSVTNREYIVNVNIDLDEECSLFATVNANLFLKLISQTTSETVELNVVGNNLEVIGNGKYKLPLVYDEVSGAILKLPDIKINNVTNRFNIDSANLNSMLTYNSKNIPKDGAGKPIMMMYYLDSDGCITSTMNSACVNKFNLGGDVRVLLPTKLVKLFKLFKDGDVNFKIGYDSVSGSVVQTKVSFESDDVSITSIISCDDYMLSTMKDEFLRGVAYKVYPYAVSLNKNDMLQMINRLSLFATSELAKSRPYAKFEFNKDSVTVYDIDMRNKESIYYDNGELNVSEPVVLYLDLLDLKYTIEGWADDQNISISFGDGQFVVITKGNIKNIIAEVRIK